MPPAEPAPGADLARGVRHGLAYVVVVWVVIVLITGVMLKVTT